MIDILRIVLYSAIIDFNKLNEIEIREMYTCNEIWNTELTSRYIYNSCRIRTYSDF